MSNYIFSIFPNESFVDLGLYQFGWEQCVPSHCYGPVLFTGMLAVSALLAGCSKNKDMDGKTVIEMVQYKPEALAFWYILREGIRNYNL